MRRDNWKLSDSLWSPCLSCRPRGFTQAPHAPCRPSLTQCSSPWIPQAPPSPYLQGSRNCEQGRELREKKAPVTVSPLSPTPASLPPAPTEGEGTTALKRVISAVPFTSLSTSLSSPRPPQPDGPCTHAAVCQPRHSGPGAAWGPQAHPFV